MKKRNTVLIVDDLEINRSLLSDILSPSYDILEASNGVEAVKIISHNYSNLSLVVLDTVMPEMDGFGVLVAMNDNNWIENIPVIMLVSDTSPEVLEKAFKLGASDYITRPFDSVTITNRIGNTIALQAKQKALEDMVAEHIMEREQNNAQLVEVLSNIVEFRNGESSMHVFHIRTITDVLLHRLRYHAPQYKLTAKKISLISNASSMHDIGKICISTAILNKNDKLSHEEYEIIKSHPMAGAKIIENVPSFRSSELLKVAYEICRWHHERYDGRGYPDGLKGDNIPLSAQVVAIADAYDSLISRRSYKPVYSHEKAMRMIVDGECGAFNPVLVECFLECGNDIKASLNNSDGRGSEKVEVSHFVTEMIESRDLRISGRTLALLEQEREKTRFYSSMSKEILFEYDISNDLLEISEWGAKYLSIPEIIARPFINPEFPNWAKSAFLDIMEKLKTVTHGNSVIKDKYNMPYEGEEHWFRVVVRPLWDNADSDTYSRIIGKMIDIHSEVKTMNELRELSDIDTLTVLYNRRAAEKMIEYVLSKSGSENYILILIDLDSFKHFNDTYGHGFGDDVLKAVANNIQKCIGKDDIAARIGGDEFVLFMDCGSDPISTASKVFKSLPIAGDDYTITASMGVAVCSDKNTTCSQLMRHADIALYAAKREGKNNFRFFDANLPNFPTVRTPIDRSLTEQD